MRVWEGRSLLLFGCNDEAEGNNEYMYVNILYFEL